MFELRNILRLFFLYDFLFQSGGNQGKEDKRKNSEVKNTSELEKTIRKLTDENRRLTADLNDEKAKVLALADMREEDEGLDLSEPPTPKKSRRFSSKRKGKPPTSPGDVEEPAPAKSPEKKKAPRTPKAKSTPASKPKAEMAEVSSVSKRGRQSKKVAYEEIDISPVEQEEEEEIAEEEMPPLIQPKKGKGKNNKSIKNSKKGDPEKEPEIAAELPPAITTKGKAKGSKKTAVSIVEPKDEIPLPPEPQPKVKGKKKKESKVGAEIVAEPPPLPPPTKASKGKKVKIVEEIVPDVQPKLNKKSQKKSQPPPPPPVAQNKKGGIKRKASDSSENVKQPAAKKGRKR